MLRTLTGQLAAVPGRKEVILFSDGILADSPSLAVNTMLAVFGVNRMDVSAVTSDIGLQRDALDELTKLQESARAAGVAFFTLDTRTVAARGYHDMVEFDRPVNFMALGANPWAEAYDSTSGSLSTLADATGGRSFQGDAELTEKVARAADTILFPALGVLLVGLVMLKGIFNKATACLAVPMGITGIIFMGSYIVGALDVFRIINALLATVCYLFAGYRLYRLGRQ